MKILSHLHPTLTVVAQSRGCTEEDIQDLARFSPVPVPAEYVSIVREATEVEIQVDLGNDGIWFLRIWGPSGCIDMNESYKIQEAIPASLAIGDDEGCGMLTLLPHASPAGIYLIRTSYIDMNGATYIAKDLTDLLVEGKNLNLIF